MSTFFPVSLLVVLTACGSAPERPDAPQSWGAAENVVQVDNLYFAGQPDEAGLVAARDAGVSIVIDMRGPGERDWDEASAAGGLGLQYVNVPVARSGPGFDPATVAMLNRLVEDNPDQQILLHCASGNRAAAWYAIYLVEERGMALDEALAIAARAGMTRPALEERVREYLDSR